MNDNFSHTSVMLDECIEYLNIDKDGIYVDCTAGGGGHSSEILKRLSSKGLLIAIDRDQRAVEEVDNKLGSLNCQGNYIVVKDNYLNVEKIIKKYAPGGVSGILMDLGVSSYQLDNASRGFSYHEEASLDMRMDTNQTKTAFDVVNHYTKEEITNILFRYGEEKYARRIADAIIYKRQTNSIETTIELANIIKQAYPAKDRFKGKHPARKTFQAIRIEVNDELTTLKNMLNDAAFSLKLGGRLVIITFHSLEDRIVKVNFSTLERPCDCPPDFPICVCKKISKHKKVFKKPLIPSELEINNNSRSRSAKLRVLERTLI